MSTGIAVETNADPLEPPLGSQGMHKHEAMPKLVVATQNTATAASRNNTFFMLIPGSGR